MKWSLLALAAVLILSGCQNRQPAVNPFLGPTVVPAPATGAAAPGSAPYYQGSPLQGTPPPAYNANGSLPPAGNYNIQTAPPVNTLPTVPGTAPGSMPPPTYAPPAGNSYRQPVPRGSSTRVAPVTTDALAARGEIRPVRVASSDVVYLDESIPVASPSPSSSGSSIQTVGSGPSNEPSISVPSDSRPDRLQMLPSGGVRQVSYDAPAAAGNQTRSNGRTLFAPPPLPYENRRPSVAGTRTPNRSTITRPTNSRMVGTQPSRPQRSPVSYSAATRTAPRTTLPEPRRFVTPPVVVEISDLPEARSSRSGVRPQSPVVRQVPTPAAVATNQRATVAPTSQTRVSSYVASPRARRINPQPTLADNPQPTPAGRLSTEQSSAKASPTQVAPVGSRPQPSPRYGHDPSYRWVTGKLEYSRAKQQWKLRYIPVDGDTDKYGGSVLITNVESIQAFQAGDYVALQGAIVKTAGESRTFAPNYQVSRAKALSN